MSIAQGVLILALLAAAFFTVVPVLPGTLFVPVGALAYGWLATFEPLSGWFWIGQIVLVGLAFAVDNVVQAFGVQRAGGSRSAMWGGAIGVVVGPLLLAPLLGPFALFLGPPAGAILGTVAGELRHRRNAPTGSPQAQLHRLGVASAAAYLASMAAKLVLLALQIAWVVIVVW